jgi:2-polyprenyl-3-methyl-5-hydroxy-6-metoxy-1,4-benzoquinol methylase
MTKQSTINFDKNFYNIFHRTTNAQNKIISEDDYTHGPLLALLRTYLKGRDLNILDIGCGTGALSIFCASKHHHVTGVDISDRAIIASQQYAKEVGLEKNTDFKIGTIDNLTFKKKLNMVCAIEIIEHVSDDDAFLEKLSRIMATNGILILTTPSLYAPLYRLGFLTQFDQRVGHVRRYDMRELLQKIKRSGFTIVKKYETEGILRNFLYTSTLGTKILLKVVNRSGIIQKCVEWIDGKLINVCGASDYMIVAKKV